MWLADLCFAITFFRVRISAFENSCFCDYLFLKNISADGQNIDLQWKNRREFHRKYLKSASALTHWRKSLIADEKFEICTYRHLKISKCIWLNLSFTSKNDVVLSRIWFLQLKSRVGSSVKVGLVSNLLRPTGIVFLHWSVWEEKYLKTPITPLNTNLTT